VLGDVDSRLGKSLEPSFLCPLGIAGSRAVDVRREALGIDGNPRSTTTECPERSRSEEVENRRT
jgi:hypothetical protein